MLTSTPILWETPKRLARTLHTVRLIPISPIHFVNAHEPIEFDHEEGPTTPAGDARPLLLQRKLTPQYLKEPINVDFLSNNNDDMMEKSVAGRKNLKRKQVDNEPQVPAKKPASCQLMKSVYNLRPRKQINYAETKRRKTKTPVPEADHYNSHITRRKQKEQKIVNEDVEMISDY